MSFSPSACFGIASLTHPATSYIYIGGLPYDLTEGDVVCIFSQYGEPVDVQLSRDKSTGRSRGFCWLKYEDQRSTVLAVDNLSGVKVLGRTLKVDHVASYRLPKILQGNGDEDDPLAEMNVAPVGMLNDDQLDARRRRGDDVDGQLEHARQTQDFSVGLDPEDPMYAYLINERRVAAEAARTKTKDRSERDHGSRRRRHSRERARREDEDRYGSSSRRRDKSREERRRRRRSSSPRRQS